MATEYIFWEERLPEILVRFGEPVFVQTKNKLTFAPEWWTTFFEKKLTDCQDSLSQESQNRQPVDFETVLRGGAGQGGIYDFWRAAKARWHGHDFRPEHGRK